MPHSRASILSRRNLIQLGGASYLGLNWGSLIRAQVAAAEAVRPGSIRSCILLFYYGGPSHLDTYDMKPSAPVEIRGTLSHFCSIEGSEAIRFSRLFDLQRKPFFRRAVDLRSQL